MEEKRPSQPKRKTAAEALRERKTAAYQARLDSDREAIAKREEARKAIAGTDVTGLRVLHKIFGKGVVTSQTASSVTAAFDSGEKRFMMPSAFAEGFLEAEDAEIGEKWNRYRELGKEVMRVREDMAAAVCAIQRLEK